ncbi:MAG: glycosyltransferase family protein, partial [Verrucomicrobiaceae bacterium]
LVRRANRDGHSMRTFELAAVGGCLAVEDTTEHREIFGHEGKYVYYFTSIADLLALTSKLLADCAERQRLATAVRSHIIDGGRHTYAARLGTITALCVAPSKQLPS